MRQSVLIAETVVVDCFEIEKWASAKPGEVEAIVKRFEGLDDTLAPVDIARAYVAQAYVGDGCSDLDFNRMALDTMMKTGRVEDALRLAWDVACRDPFNLDALDVLLRIVPPQHDIWKVAAWRFSRLLRAIASTGDGTSTRSAFCVVCVQDEYMLMRAALELGEISSQELVVEGLRSYDRFTVAPGDKFPHTSIYFEITPFNISAL